jgi:hypothetical protein
VKRPAFWILLALASLAAVAVGVRLFPQAFSILALDISMDRERALSDARRIVGRDHLGPPNYRQAASFALDDEAQTFVELEGGGKEAFTGMMRDGLYAAYTWRVRHFEDGETNETTIRFTPDGRPYGFEEKLKEDAPGAALPVPAARRLAEAGATSRWNVPLNVYGLVEQGQERRTGGRIDHSFTYERAFPTLNEGRYRVRLVVSGDRLTEVTYFLKIPEAFSRRYESMRSANEAIGIASVVGMALLYVFGGIGIGLFFMLRQGWVVWRPAILWGFVVSLFQTLAALNELPLIWMTYDTALPRSTFLAQELARIVAMFVGFGVFYALSFMAAETLTRRAFGSHPQFWRVWARTAAQDPAHPGRSAPGPGSSTAILGRTVGGYLLVAIFFAYDVLLYLVTTKTLGWWSPSEALLHPDVLATYAPWLSAIGNSFQAGFWEESLFRAVPIAGAALIGDRFGNRRLFIVLAFIVQAIIFGAGHAPYPNQPAYARPVELILPSIGFGLIYLYFGLLPGIVLHFTFDVVWFALPIFLANAPGVWIQKVMVVAMTLIPLWVILWRRMQAGAWTALSPLDRNAAWTPPRTMPQAFVPDAVRPKPTLSARARSAWLALGAVGILVSVGAILTQSPAGRLPVTRDRAADAARRALLDRGVSLDRRWRIMPMPDDGSGSAAEFVSETAGEARRLELAGSYLPEPHWNVRIVTFEGDVAERAEEWRVFVANTGEVRSVRHTLPEARPGTTLDEASARALAQRTVLERYHLDVSRGQAREVSAKPQKLSARTDWTFTYVDTTIAPLPQGEPRIAVDLAGDEVAATGRFIYIPEEWQRQNRAAETRNFVLQILVTLVFGGLLVSAAVAGVIAWSRHEYTPRVFVVTAALMLAVSVAKLANSWPTVLAGIPTAVPLAIAVAGVVGIGIVGLLLSASLAGLSLGAQPRLLDDCGYLDEKDAIRVAIGVGLFAAAVAAVGGWLRMPAWARVPDLAALGTIVPILQLAIDPITGFLTRTAVILSTLVSLDRFTSGWSERRLLAIAAVVVIGFLAAGMPIGVHLRGWLLAGTLTSLGFMLVSLTALRFDLTMVPLVLGTTIAVGAIGRGAQRAFPGALIGSWVGAIIVAAAAWWLFRLLRTTRGSRAGADRDRAGPGVRSRFSNFPAEK